MILVSIRKNSDEFFDNFETASAIFGLAQIVIGGKILEVEAVDGIIYANCISIVGKYPAKRTQYLDRKSVV